MNPENLNQIKNAHAKASVRALKQICSFDMKICRATKEQGEALLGNKQLEILAILATKKNAKKTETFIFYHNRVVLLPISLTKCEDFLVYYGQHVKNQTLNQQVLTELMLKVYKTDSAKLYKISCATPHVTLTPIGKGEVQININLLRIHSIEPQKSQTVFAIGPKEAAEPVLKVTSPLEMRSLEDTLIKGYYCAGIMAREFGNIHHFCEEDKQDLFKLLDFHPSFVAINFIKDIPFADLDYNYNDYHKVLDNKKNWKKVKRRVKKITDQERGFACDVY